MKWQIVSIEFEGSYSRLLINCILSSRMCVRSYSRFRKYDCEVRYIYEYTFLFKCTEQFIVIVACLIVMLGLISFYNDINGRKY